MLAREEVLNNFKGIKISRTSPSISHLLFADDLVIFCRATVEDASCIKQTLDCFSDWSNQVPNCDKIMSHFSANTTSHTKVDILNILRFKECTHQTKHLGPHFCKIATKKIAFSAISDKISSSLKGWKAKVFSQASRTILTKAVAQAIPTYYLANSLFPKHISRNLDAKFRKFWWGENEKGNSLVIKCWDSICSPTACGGLGFRRMKDYNMALCRLGSLLLTRMFSGFKF